MYWDLKREENSRDMIVWKLDIRSPYSHRFRLKASRVTIFINVSLRAQQNFPLTFAAGA
jgi:hypothetical protein